MEPLVLDLHGLGRVIIPGTRTRVMIRVAASLLGAASVVTFTGAQERGAADEPAVFTKDSSRVADLEEQLAGSGEGRALEREEEASASARWTGTWKVRAGGVLQRAAGYSDGTFAGDRLALFQRISLRRGDRLRVDLLTDKDPGERGPVDFLTGSLGVALVPGAVRVVAGDFRVRSGQGLLFGGSRTVGKGAATIAPVVRGAWGIPEGVSPDEARFHRGIAAELAAGPVAVIAFGSSRRSSGSFSGEGELLGIDVSGYHRTASEVAARGSVAERAVGGAVKLNAGRDFAAGGAFLSTSVRPDSPPGGNSLRGGRIVRRWSIDLRGRIGALTAFGEAVPSDPGRPWIAGAVFDDGAGRRAALVHRSYPPADDFRPVAGFADASNGNEKGTYLGVELSLPGAVTAAGYLDLVSRIAPARGVVQPPAVLDGLVSVRVAPEGAWAAEIRYRTRVAERRVPAAAGEGPSVPMNGPESERRIRIDLRWTPAGGCRGDLRLDGCVAMPAGGRAEQGGMVSAGVGAASGRLSFSLAARVFGTSSFASGITTVEPDLPGTVAPVVYYGRGAGWSATLTWAWSRHFRLSGRYSALHRADTRRLGSGAGELPANIREKAGLQIDVLL